MNRTKQGVTERKYKILPSSYAVQTANTLLRNYGVELSKEETAAQLTSTHSFYKKLLQIPAISIYNAYLLRQCNDIQFYCAEQVLNILFASNTLQAEHPEKKPALSDKKQQDVVELQNRNSRINEDFQAILSQHEVLTQQTEAVTRQAVRDWHSLCVDSAGKIIAKLHELGFQLSESFQAKLIKKLEKYGAVTLPSENLTQLEIKTQLSAIEKAVLSTLIEEFNRG